MVRETDKYINIFKIKHQGRHHLHIPFLSWLLSIHVVELCTTQHGRENCCSSVMIIVAVLIWGWRTGALRPDSGPLHLFWCWDCHYFVDFEVL